MMVDDRLLQLLCVASIYYTSCCCCSVTKLCPTLCNPMDCSPPDSSFHGILQARILAWVAIFFSRGSSRLKDWTRVSCTGRQILYHWVTREAPNYVVFEHLSGEPGYFPFQLKKRIRNNSCLSRINKIFIYHFPQSCVNLLPSITK